MEEDLTPRDVKKKALITIVLVGRHLNTTRSMMAKERGFLARSLVSDSSRKVESRESVA